MKALQRPGRAAAVVGAVVAVSATSLIALVGGTASANEPGKCVDNVNVRAEPDPTSDIVALCEKGTTVAVGETRNGHVKLVDLGGWSAAEFISIDGARPGAARADTPGSGPSGADDPTGGASSEFGSSEDGSSNGSGSGTTDGQGQAQPAPKPAPAPGPLSGLLG